ncbi:hypothetical protein VST63_15050 [Mycolicibacterium sp. 050232]|uniref:hypothetical protein n=1 Tax=Mycolicibacterium sp. 050232 TaxID=3113982 RepID=UPI002E2BF079|nr:hypothetical protein [Mycolicibacterium sp. 050232]MED5813675.1 hypothetical protein [Mycolicibacterium sp. 050232]
MTNVGSIAETVLANPAPILGKIAENGLVTADVFASVANTFLSGFVAGVGTVPQQIEDAIRNGILEGNIYDGVLALATAFLYPVVSGAFGALVQLPNITAVLKNPFLNTASVIETAVTGAIVNVGLPLLTNVLAPVAQIGYTGQAIYDAVQAGDFEAVANAVISFPSDMVNTIINSSPPEVGIPGLLGPGGLVSCLLTLRQAIADSVHPPVLSSPPSLSVAEAPDLKAASVTVDIAESPAADTAAADVATDDVGTDDGVAADDEAPKSTVSVAVVKDSPVQRRRIAAPRLTSDPLTADQGTLCAPVRCVSRVGVRTPAPGRLH